MDHLASVYMRKHAPHKPCHLSTLFKIEHFLTILGFTRAKYTEITHTHHRTFNNFMQNFFLKRLHYKIKIARVFGKSSSLNY